MEMLLRTLIVYKIVKQTAKLVKYSKANLILI